MCICVCLYVGVVILFYSINLFIYYFFIRNQIGISFLRVLTKIVAFYHGNQILHRIDDEGKRNFLNINRNTYIEFEENIDKLIVNCCCV